MTTNTDNAIETDEFTTTTVIPAGNLPTFREKLVKLNTRAKRLKCAPITATTTVDHTQTEVLVSGKRHWVDSDKLDAFIERRAYFAPTPTGRVREFLALTVTGEAPKYKGWAFVATLSPLPTDTGQASNIVKSVPGAGDIPPEFRHRVGQCDHCNTTRQRVETFVVRNDSGTHRMVGRNCLKDFLGHSDPHRMALWASILGDLTRTLSDYGNESYGSREIDAWDLEHFLEWTASVVRKDGWTSAGAAWNDPTLTSTKSTVLYLLQRPYGDQGAKEWREARAKYLPDDKAQQRASEASSWVRGLAGEIEESGKVPSDYMSNLALVGSAGYVRQDLAGMAASILVAFAKAQEREIERKRRAASLNEWRGTLKTRETFTLTVRKVIPVEGSYGSTGIHVMSDAEGRSLKWFASESATWLEVGETYTVKATVVKHETYKDQKTTVINRVKEAAPKAS